MRDLIGLVLGLRLDVVVIVFANGGWACWGFEAVAAAAAVDVRVVRLRGEGLLLGRSMDAAAVAEEEVVAVGAVELGFGFGLSGEKRKRFSVFLLS